MAVNTGVGRPMGRQQGGFAYLLIPALVVVMGAGLAMLGTQWDLARQREREDELLVIGNQYRQAIGLYYQQSPGSMKRYPTTLNDLLKDPRTPRTERYLRRPYRDPLTQEEGWGLVKAPDGGIMGVFSQSEKAPLKRANFTGADVVFEEIAVQRGDQLRYADWQFVYQPQPALPVLQPRGGP